MSCIGELLIELVLACVSAGPELVSSVRIVLCVCIANGAIVPVNVKLDAIGSLSLEVSGILLLLGVLVTFSSDLACTGLPSIDISNLYSSGSIFEILTARALVVSLIAVLGASSTMLFNRSQIVLMDVTGLSSNHESAELTYLILGFGRSRDVRSMANNSIVSTARAGVSVTVIFLVAVLSDVAVLILDSQRFFRSSNLAAIKISITGITKVVSLHTVLYFGSGMLAGIFVNESAVVVRSGDLTCALLPSGEISDFIVASGIAVVLAARAGVVIIPTVNGASCILTLGEGAGAGVNSGSGNSNFFDVYNIREFICTCGVLSQLNINGTSCFSNESKSCKGASLVLGINAGNDTKGENTIFVGIVNAVANVCIYPSDLTSGLVQTKVFVAISAKDFSTLKEVLIKLHVDTKALYVDFLIGKSYGDCIANLNFGLVDAHCYVGSRNGAGIRLNGNSLGCHYVRELVSTCGVLSQLNINGTSCFSNESKSCKGASLVLGINAGNDTKGENTIFVGIVNAVANVCIYPSDLTSGLVQTKVFVAISAKDFSTLKEVLIKLHVDTKALYVDFLIGKSYGDCIADFYLSLIDTHRYIGLSLRCSICGSNSQRSQHTQTQQQRPKSF